MLDKYDIHDISKESIVLIANNHIFTKSDALFQLVDDMPYFWTVFKIFKIIPKNIRDWVYSWVSRNRHFIFGKIKHNEMS